MKGRKYRKVQTFLLFCRFFENSIFSKAVLRSNAACSSIINFYHELILTENCKFGMKQEIKGLNFFDNVSIKNHFFYVWSIISILYSLLAEISKCDCASCCILELVILNALSLPTGKPVSVL